MTRLLGSAEDDFLSIFQTLRNDTPFLIFKGVENIFALFVVLRLSSVVAAGKNPWINVHGSSGRSLDLWVHPWESLGLMTSLGSKSLNSFPRPL